MKQAKVLKPHVYNGKRRRVGDVYPIRRADYQLFEKLGNVRILTPADHASEQRTVEDYLTTSMQDEPPKPKRKYVRKNVKQDSDE